MDIALKALADENRRRILQLIAHGEMSVGELVRDLAITQPAVSQHLAVLREAGLVRERKDANRRFYRMRPDGMAAVRLFFDHFWDERLDGLREAAENDRLLPAVAKDQRITIEREVVIAAPVDVVWRYLTEAGKLVQWMGVSARIDATRGSAYDIEVVPGRHVTGVILAVDPPARLVQSWGWDGVGSVVSGSTIVTFDLMPVVTGTLLHLTHSDLPTPGATGTHSRGWQHYLERLQRAAGGKRVTRDPWVANPDLLTNQLLSDDGV